MEILYSSKKYQFKKKNYQLFLENLKISDLFSSKKKLLKKKKYRL